MANAAVTSNTKRIYEKTLAHLALNFYKGPQTLEKICLAVGYGPKAVENALKKMSTENLVTKTDDDCWRFTYSIWEYQRRHYWKGEHYAWYLKHSVGKMPIYKRMRLTCDMLACVIGWKHRRPDAPVLSVPEALALMQNMEWTREFEKYAYGISFYSALASDNTNLEHSALVQVVKRLGDLCGDLKDYRKVAKCVQLQRLHAFGYEKALEYMKSIDIDYRRMDECLKKIHKQNSNCTIRLSL